MIRYANLEDLELLKEYDKHISQEELINSINLKRILVMYESDKFVGWLRYNLFWDNIPFVNMLYFLDGERNKGYGSQIVGFWEDEMKKKGYNCVMTSTLSNEQAQFFYRKLGYVDRGSLLLPKEPLEVIFYKEV